MRPGGVESLPWAHCSKKSCAQCVADAAVAQVKAHAHFTLIDAMDLALLTGQRPADVLKMRCADIRDGALWVTQNKTGARLGIEVTGELAAVIARISERPRRAISPYLIQDENGQPLTYFALRSRFDKARNLAKVSFQFRDLRAKAATDTGDLAHSQKLLAHKKCETTEHYVKARVGESKALALTLGEISLKSLVCSGVE